MPPTSLPPSKFVALLFTQSAKFLRDFAFFLCERLDHAGSDSRDGIDFIPAGNDIFLLVGDEADDLVVPGGFLEFLEDFGVLPICVVINRDRLEVSFDQFDEGGVGEDFGPKDLAATSPGNFLKKKQDRFSGLF
ncbi:MAG: hypothetical protein ABF391_12860 [Akkermansiaceae bacterium]